MAGNRPEERVGLPVAHQRWRHVSFLHWRYDDHLIQQILPAGLKPHLIDGSAWVGLTPFLVEGFRPTGVPAVPGLSSFPETNLRTYAVDDEGKEGLWFLSLDVGSLVMTGLGRLGLNLPYHAAEMGVEASEIVRYHCRRKNQPASHHIEVRPGPVLGDHLSERDAALLGRWRAYSQRAGRLVRVPVTHQPWPVQTANVDALTESITTAAGLPVPEGDPIVHYSPGVDAQFGLPRALRQLRSAPVTCP